MSLGAGRLAKPRPRRDGRGQGRPLPPHGGPQVGQRAVLSTIVNGRPDLPGPLSHLHLARDGTFTGDRRRQVQPRRSRPVARDHHRQHQLHRHRGRECRRRHRPVARRPDGSLCEGLRGDPEASAPHPSCASGTRNMRCRRGERSTRRSTWSRSARRSRRIMGPVAKVRPRHADGHRQHPLGHCPRDRDVGRVQLQLRLPLRADLAQKVPDWSALGIGYAAVLAGAVAFVAGKDIGVAKANATTVWPMTILSGGSR
jgi:hypothetical protein